MSYDAVYNGTRQALSCDSSGIIERCAREAFDISWIKSQAQQAIGAIENDLRRPFVLILPRMFLDGDKWCALYGEDLMGGVAGFGDSPDAASWDFDKNWNTKIAAREVKP